MAKFTDLPGQMALAEVCDYEHIAGDLSFTEQLARYARERRLQATELFLETEPVLPTDVDSLIQGLPSEISGQNR